MIKLKEEHIDFAAVFISTLLSAIILAIVRESVTGYIDDIVEDTAERAKMKLNNKKKKSINNTDIIQQSMGVLI